ncbi:uncharacterized protein LOC111718335 isoform X2 [Eurytemora carolleeae]|uniref:uncharacterized protein LOC111718335 isoform X2 n=1 Tax=Eurytemora carolleeae TaxID=1294199 RepID=UPI000C77B485|nr:uncharacterized protein LOC111718335 isoform X2 [Eurytemora carolleeae]|eukprot:XP_023349679.1 uncharacterized protein LOC111718335 isoform X2 [Eurytemora affinis]
MLFKAVGSCRKIRARLFSSEPPSWNTISQFRWFLPIQTRWKDNDQYGHINNAVYHSIYDTVINVFLIRHVGLDLESAVLPRGYMVTNSCTFLGSARYPEVYLAGLGVSKLGNTSVRYKLCLFPQNPEESLLLNLKDGHNPTDPVVRRFAENGLVQGDFVHVFVDPKTEKPVHISQEWRSKLDLLTNHY